MNILLSLAELLQLVSQSINAFYVIIILQSIMVLVASRKNCVINNDEKS